MSGPLSSPRPIFGVKIGVAIWVSWSGPSVPANPTGNPNFNPKNRPEVKKSGPELPEFCLLADEKIAAICRNFACWRTKKLRKKLQQFRSFIPVDLLSLLIFCLSIFCLSIFCPCRRFVGRPYVCRCFVCRRFVCRRFVCRRLALEPYIYIYWSKWIHSRNCR
jgi:hypothetical protein